MRGGGDAGDVATGSADGEPLDAAAGPSSSASIRGNSGRLLHRRAPLAAGRKRGLLEESRGRSIRVTKVR